MLSCKEIRESTLKLIGVSESGYQKKLQQEQIGQKKRNKDLKKTKIRYLMFDFIQLKILKVKTKKRLDHQY
jgi:hypothetical protein